MRFCIFLALGVVSSGCLMEAVTVTAIQGELAAQNVQAGNRALGKAKDSQAEIELTSAVNSYAGTVGAYPPSLDDLVPEYIAQIPVQSNGLQFAYDAARGKVRYVPLAEGPSAVPRATVMTQGDSRNLDNLREAIYRYWEVTGYYPESLQTLAPLYIAAVPQVSSGGAFPYNKQTGIVSHPAEHQSPQASTQVGQPAGRSAGGQVGSISNGHSQKQLDVLDDLGF